MRALVSCYHFTPPNTLCVFFHKFQWITEHPPIDIHQRRSFRVDNYGLVQRILTGALYPSKVKSDHSVIKRHRKPDYVYFLASLSARNASTQVFALPGNL